MVVQLTSSAPPVITVSTTFSNNISKNAEITSADYSPYHITVELEDYHETNHFNTLPRNTVVELFKFEDHLMCYQIFGERR